MLRRARGQDDDMPDSAPDPPQEPLTEVARRMLAHAAGPEERLELLLAEHRRELEEQARRFEEAMRDLERREAQLRDMRASVDRLLRLGTSDLSERELELQELGREFMQREARLGEDEAEVNRRRIELGAVELKREALEQRERALAAREAELEAATAASETSSEDVERRAETEDRPPAALLFLAGPGYRLVSIQPRLLEPGSAVDVEGDTMVVQRVGPSPLPGDRRRCAYLVRGRAPGSASGGSW